MAITQRTAAFDPKGSDNQQNDPLGTFEESHLTGRNKRLGASARVTGQNRADQDKAGKAHIKEHGGVTAFDFDGINAATIRNNFVYDWTYGGAGWGTATSGMRRQRGRSVRVIHSVCSGRSAHDARHDDSR